MSSGLRSRQRVLGLLTVFPKMANTGHRNLVVVLGHHHPVMSKDFNSKKARKSNMFS